MKPPFLSCLRVRLIGKRPKSLVVLLGGKLAFFSPEGHQKDGLEDYKTRWELSHICRNFPPATALSLLLQRLIESILKLCRNRQMFAR